MIRLRPHVDERDQARAVVELLEQHGRHIIENAPRIAPEDKSLVETAHARLGSDFAQLSQLLNLTLNSAASAVAHDLITKVMIGSWMTGVGATYSPEAKKWVDTLKGHTANAGNVDKAVVKNAELQAAIEAEAASMGIELSISEECAKRLLPGVLTRCGQALDLKGKAPRGFNWTAIRRQIQTILSERRSS